MKIYVKSTFDLESYLQSRRTSNAWRELDSESLSEIQEVANQFNKAQLSAYIKLIAPSIFKSPSNISQDEFNKVLKVYLDKHPRRKSDGYAIELGRGGKPSKLISLLTEGLLDLGYSDFRLYHSTVRDDTWYLEFKDADSYSIEDERAEADNPNTSVERLSELSISEDWTTRYKVANNSNTPDDLLRNLFESDKSVWHGLARNPNTPLDIVKVLAKDGDFEVQGAVARRTTDDNIFNILLKSKYMTSGGVAYELAANPNTPSWVLESVINMDIAPAARYDLLKHRNMPKNILEEYAFGDDERFAKVANENLKRSSH